MFTALDDDGGISWCAGTEAFVRLLQGRLHQAGDLARALLLLAQGLDDRWGAAVCLTIDGFAAAGLMFILVMCGAFEANIGLGIWHIVLVFQVRGAVNDRVRR